ncbi:hypothetical protein P7C70_g8561, partial [Phenoliferia sp. Uapishka_3]
PPPPPKSVVSAQTKAIAASQARQYRPVSLKRQATEEAAGQPLQKGKPAARDGAGGVEKQLRNGVKGPNEGAPPPASSSTAMGPPTQISTPAIPKAPINSSNSTILPTSAPISIPTPTIVPRFTASQSQPPEASSSQTTRNNRSSAPPSSKSVTIAPLLLPSTSNGASLSTPSSQKPAPKPRKRKGPPGVPHSPKTATDKAKNISSLPSFKKGKKQNGEVDASEASPRITSAAKGKGKEKMVDLHPEIGMRSSAGPQFVPSLSNPPNNAPLSTSAIPPAFLPPHLSVASTSTPPLTSSTKPKLIIRKAKSKGKGPPGIPARSNPSAASTASPPAPPPVITQSVPTIQHSLTLPSTTTQNPPPVPFSPYSPKISHNGTATLDANLPSSSTPKVSSPAGTSLRSNQSPVPVLSRAVRQRLILESALHMDMYAENRANGGVASMIDDTKKRETLERDLEAARLKKDSEEKEKKELEEERERAKVLDDEAADRQRLEALHEQELKEAEDARRLEREQIEKEARDQVEREKEAFDIQEKASKQQQNADKALAAAAELERWRAEDDAERAQNEAGRSQALLDANAGRVRAEKDRKEAEERAKAEVAAAKLPIGKRKLENEWDREYAATKAREAEEERIRIASARVAEEEAIAAKVVDESQAMSVEGVETMKGVDTGTGNKSGPREDEANESVHVGSVEAAINGHLYLARERHHQKTPDWEPLIERVLHIKSTEEGKLALLIWCVFTTLLSQGLANPFLSF